MSSLFSLVRIDSGVVVKGGKELDLRHVQDSVSAGIAMLSEDRRRYGNIPNRARWLNRSRSDCMLLSRDR